MTESLLSLANKIVESKPKKETQPAVLRNGTQHCFDPPHPHPEIEAAYQAAYARFSIARETMPEWIAYEEAIKAWRLKGLFDANARVACAASQEAYTTACNTLPEWKAYFAALKRREELKAQGRRR